MRPVITLAAVFLAGIVPTLASAQTFQPSKLPASGRDSLEIFYQGQVLGYALFTYGREGGNYRVVSEASIPSASVQQRDDVLFNATTFMPIKFMGRGTVQGMEMSSDVSVTDGRAKGTASKPSAAGVQAVTIDVELPAGVLGDGTELVLIPTLDLSEGLVMSFKSVDGTTGEIKTNEITVGAKDTVTVPAGAFEVYRIAMKATQPVTFFATTSAPRRIVLIRIEGQGMEMRLAKP